MFNTWYMRMTESKNTKSMTRFLENFSRLISFFTRVSERKVLDGLGIMNQFFIFNHFHGRDSDSAQVFLNRFFDSILRHTQLNLHTAYQKMSEPGVWRVPGTDSPVDIPFKGYVRRNRHQMYKKAVARHDYHDGKIGQILTCRIRFDYFYVVWLNDARFNEQILVNLQVLLTEFTSRLTIQDDLSTSRRQLSDAEVQLREKSRSLIIAERAVKRKVYDLHNLVEASNEIYSILNYKQLINSALLTIIGQIGSQNAFSLMYDIGRHAFSMNFQKGFKPAEVQSLKFRSESGIARFLFEKGSPFFVSELADRKDLKNYHSKLKKLKINIIAPIIYSERLQGIIGVGDKLYGQEFTQTDFELFHVLVNIISISIENALHYEEVKNLSLTDAMTGLHNYRYFSIRLKEELNRARRNKTRVSLLILDIDHFKNYNDTLGHQAGDEALRTVGRILKSTVRDEDVVSRYGGEEFCIILPGISKSGIRPLGDRVRRIIEVHKFYKERVQPGGRLTISIGASAYPEDAQDTDELIQKADNALYMAKHRGRNQLIIYDPAERKKRVDQKIELAKN